MNRWKAGKPPRLAPNPPGIDEAIQKALNSVGITNPAPKPPVIQHPALQITSHRSD
jgi:hypothetical protein